MSCCSCPVQPCPSKYAPWLLRIGYGLMIAGFGVNHYRDLANFVTMAKGPFAAVPFIAMVAGLLAYVLPALEIVGGALFAIRWQKCVAKVCLLATFGGIMGWAGVGMMVVDMSDPQASMQTSMMLGTAFQGAVMALLGYWLIKKMDCCGCACGKDGCSCGKK